MKYGLIGEKLSHSLSHEIHSLLGNSDYSLFEISDNGLHTFMEAKSFSGINVTVPYKERVLPYLDAIDSQAERIGAVNTIINRGGKLIGYNTDCIGFLSLIKKHNINVKGKKVAVLGSGGTSKTVKVCLKDLGTGKILTVSRSKTDKESFVTYDELYEVHSDIEILINTTPVGMYPNNDASPIADLSVFKNLEAVVDVVYNPLSTSLILKARERNITAVGGLYMLVSQGVSADALFFDKKPTDTDMIYERIRKQTEVPVLIGMPTSGKTTVGKELAKRLGREFADTDTMIEEKTKMHPSEIISKLGEEHFRKIETEVIKELSKKQGIVISTGGGSILSSDNIRHLKMNGRLFFLDRPYELLTCDSSRPLSSTRKELLKMYGQRRPLYTSACDRKVNADMPICDIVNAISEEYEI